MAQNTPTPVSVVSADEVRKLNAVTSTGTKTPEEAFKLPFTVDVIDREEIERRRPYKLDDLLRDIPGVDGVAGPRRSSQTPSVRGVDGNRVLVTVDGARQNFDVIETVRVLEERLAHITTPLTVSVIGCVVNGPGEAAMTDIGLTGGGKGTHQIYVSGRQDHRIKDVDIVEHLVGMIERKAAEIEAAAAQPETVPAE